MKILCTGDLHINDWMPFSSLDQFGRPSRLLDYIKLAKIITTLAETEQCEAIFVAGDISESAVQKPMVHDIIGDFLRIISSQVPVYLIHGQHDCSSKEASSMGTNSILKEICKDLSNVHYSSDPELVQINDYKVWFQPWTEGHELSGPDADIFVGHGIVTGCTNLDGYVFINGFNKNNLLSKYRLSVIGDIHKRQEHNDPEQYPARLVLQPGAPIQNTWKDHPDCGLYTVELVQDKVSCKFHEINKLAPDTFHQFIYDQEQLNSELIHSRPKVRIKKDNDIKKSLEIKRDNTVIFDTCVKLINNEDNINKEEIISYLHEVFENTELSSDKVISKSKILNVKAENFLSIDKVELDFNEFPKSCVIVGHNGSGKTTIPEAIYWCLTGNTTKSTTIDTIINTMNNAEDCSVIVDLLINNHKYSIERKRKGKSGSLTIYDSNNNSIKCSSMRETQAQIYSLLGLQEWQIYMFSYFSAEKTSLFANLGESSKGDLISQIVGLDFVDSMKEYSKKQKNKIKNEYIKNEGVQSEKEAVLLQLNNKLNKLQGNSNEEKIKKINLQINNLKNELRLLEEENQNLEQNFESKYSTIKLQEIDTSSDSKEYYELQSKYEELKSKKVILESSLNKTKLELKEAVSGKCPTCKQSLHDKDLINSLKEQVSKEFTSLKELNIINELEEQLKEKHDTLLTNQTTNKDIKFFKSNQQEIQKSIFNIITKINELEKQLLIEDTDSKLIENINIDIKTTEEAIETLCKKQTKTQNKIKNWTFLESKLFKRNGSLVQELNRQGSELIQQCIDEVLFGLDIDISINRDLQISGKFHTKTVQYGGMSSGQKRLTDITLMVSLNNLFSKIYNLENGVLGLVVYDEILSFLDEKYIDCAKQIVDQSISDKLLIITHDNKLMNMYDSKIKVSLTSTGSNYIKSWD